jgi:hypothetical protein
MPAKGQDGKAVAEKQPTTITTPSPFQMLLRKMEQMATLDTESARNRGEDINPILTAETEAEMWEADELPRFNAKMLSGCDMQILGFDVKFGTGEPVDNPVFRTADGRDLYLLVESVRINRNGDKIEYRLPPVGEEFIWNTSARNIVGKLFWMLEHGWFDNGHSPVHVHIKGTDLGKGKSVEKLKPIADTFVESKAEETPF